jgi:nucleoside-diphosphate-sugar epimerase
MSEPVERIAARNPFTVAVTGGTGFIGGAILRQLLQADLRVRALVRPTSRSSCFEAPGLTWIPGDLGDTQSLRLLVAGTSAVVHCAGAVRGRSAADFAAANVAGVKNLVRAVREVKECDRFLLLSSLAAREPALSAYAASKRQGELVLQDEASDFNWMILRPPAVYGPGDRELLPLLQWLRRGVLFSPGRGEGRFSLLFVTDLARAVLCWLQSDAGSGGCCELHDGRVRGYCWEEVRQIGAQLYGRPVRRIAVPQGLLRAAAHLNAAAARLGGYRPMLTPGKVRELCHDDWICDNTLFSSATRWRPEIDLREGLRRTLGR